jgi:NADH-quinone oxidoreductase subunit G
LAEIASGRHPFAERLKQAQHPIILVGQGALSRADGKAIAALAARTAVEVGAVKEGWNGFSVLHTVASRVGAFDLGLVPGEGGMAAQDMAAGDALDVLFLLGADEIEVAPGAFVIYIGTHGDRGAHRADVILPGAAYTEKTGLTVNTEGRVQLINRAGFPPGNAREDWAILRALSDQLGTRLPYDSLNQLRAALFKAHPALARLDVVEPSDAADVRRLPEMSAGAVDRAPFHSPIDDFYLTNPIARASAIMAECSALARRAAPAIAAE